ncbi:MAG: phage holin family protein [Candidatus Levybacteria bacterium]|nr:phage holin family protein [Candidatus Levybacteria bacterium]
MILIINTLIMALAVVISAYLLQGVHVSSFLTAILVAIVLGFVNAFLKPLLVLLTLPVTIVTLGLFLLIINALIILLVSAVVPGFKVDGFWWALIYSIVLSIVSSILNFFTK